MSKKFAQEIMDIVRECNGGDVLALNRVMNRCKEVGAQFHPPKKAEREPEAEPPAPAPEPEPEPEAREGAA